MSPLFDSGRTAQGNAEDPASSGLESQARAANTGPPAAPCLVELLESTHWVIALPSQSMRDTYVGL